MECSWKDCLQRRGGLRPLCQAHASTRLLNLQPVSAYAGAFLLARALTNIYTVCSDCRYAIWLVSTCRRQDLLHGILTV